MDKETIIAKIAQLERELSEIVIDKTTITYQDNYILQNLLTVEVMKMNYGMTPSLGTAFIVGHGQKKNLT